MISWPLAWAQDQSVTLTGQVVGQEGGQPIAYATVLLVDAKTQEGLAGVSTDLEGRFTLRGAVADQFFVDIRLMGYEPRRIEAISLVEGRADLGTIALMEQSLTTDEVEIIGETSSVEFQLDKRVFNVGKDLSSAGGSAFDVLNQVPSVNVNIEGEVSLRGNAGVQILINGKPSVLTSEQGNALGTITADMIERIEVITNPSAKYQAEGTSGIINIILKKEEKQGTNGSVSLNTGWPHNHSLGLSLNRRANRFNLFTQLGAGYRSLPDQLRNLNQDLVSQATLYSEGTEYRNENFYNLILGTDYHIDDHNVLTLSGSFAYEIEDQPSQTDFRLEDGQGALISAWQRNEITQATNPKWQYELQYKRSFEDDEDHSLLVSALGNFFGKDQSSDFLNTTLLGENRDLQQQTRTNFQEALYTFKIDYAQPIKEVWSIETGAQYVANDVSNDFAVSNLVNGALVTDAAFTNVFQYDQGVLGAYGTGAYEGNRWGVKLGLRLENTTLNTLLVSTEEANDQQYLNLFPSAHSSYKINEFLSFQAGYSRRIRRPRLWDLNPFFNIRNNFNIRTGNPNLQPEFTDSYELSGIYLITKASFNASLFHRYVTQVIERVSTFNEGITTTTPLNIGTNQVTGVEVNFKFDPFRFLSINGEGNWLYFNRKGTLETTSFDFAASRWGSKLTSQFKLPADINLELSGQYASSYQTIQGTDAGNLFADIGIRKKILNKKAVLNLGVRDLFASRVDINETFQDDFYLYSRRQRGRFITLGFSYGFGKGEAMSYSGKR
jgi:outer membrane receptor protein involved in Fe transport